MTINLPKGASAFEDRHGKQRIRFRRSGLKTTYPKHPFGTKEFEAEYAAWMTQKPAPSVERPKVVPRSVDDLCILFYPSGDFGGNADTRARNRAILDRFRAKHGNRPVATCPFTKLDKYIQDVAQTSGGGAAEKARKQLKRLFRYAVKLGWMPTNPMDFVNPVKYEKQPFHSWTEDEIAQYQAYHSLGTQARLALELYLWTAKRRGDGLELGRQHIRDGYFYSIDAKTGKRSWIPIAPDLAAAIAAMPPHNHLTLIVTEYGKPFSKNGFGEKFKTWCCAAGLPHCTAHGLRKAIMRRMAELGVGNAGMKAISMHSDDREVAAYTASANQKMMAARSIELLAGHNWLTHDQANLANPRRNGGNA